MNIIDKWNPFNKIASPVSQELTIVNTFNKDNFFQKLPEEIVTDIFYQLFTSCKNLKDILQTFDRISGICKRFRANLYDERFLRSIRPLIVSFIPSIDGLCIKKIDFQTFKKRFKVTNRFIDDCYWYQLNPDRAYENTTNNCPPENFFSKQLQELKKVDASIDFGIIFSKMRIINDYGDTYQPPNPVSIFGLPDGLKKAHSRFWRNYGKWWQAYETNLFLSYAWWRFYPEDLICSSCEIPLLVSTRKDLPLNEINLEP